MPVKENREFLRKVLGYSITGNNLARKFFIWYGHGSNGKSKVLKCIDKILSIQYVQCDKSIFMKEKKSAQQASPEIMALLGKRFGAYSEGETSDNIEMNMAGLKQISGEDKQTGRYLFKNTVEFYPIVKLHLLTNFVPQLHAEKAVVNRLVYVFFDSVFSETPQKGEIKVDRDFAAKIENEYLSEIFTWIVKGSAKYYEDEQITMPLEFQKRTKKILSNEDSIKTFIDRNFNKLITKKIILKSLSYLNLTKSFVIITVNDVKLEVHYLLGWKN